jgi:transposase
MSKKYVLKLTTEERSTFETLVRQGKAAGWKIQRAQALLKFDAGPKGSGWTDSQIAEAFGCTVRCLENWRKQAVESGPASLLERKPRPPQVGKFDGEKQAQLTKLACSRAPAGRTRWSLRLLAERAVELKIVEAASHETVRRALKKRVAALA